MNEPTDRVIETSDVTVVARLIAAKGWRLIAIDGMDGTGKSELAAQLAEALGVPAVGLDDFVEKQQGGYVPFIDFERLSMRVRALKEFIVEGVCLIEILERLGIEIDGLIYVKQRSSGGLWSDEDRCVFPEGVEAAIRKQYDDLEVFLEFEALQKGETYIRGSAGRLELTEELMHYHDRFRPHERAAIVFWKDLSPNP